MVLNGAFPVLQLLFPPTGLRCCISIARSKFDDTGISVFMGPTGYSRAQFHDLHTLPAIMIILQLVLVLLLGTVLCLSLTVA